MELNKENMKKIMLLILYTIVILSLAFHIEYAAKFLKTGLQLLFPFSGNGDCLYFERAHAVY